MYQTVNFNMFHDAFKAIRPDNFSYEGLKALFEHLEQYEEDSGVPIKLDVIALCCEFSEIDCDDSEYANYMGDDAERSDLLIAEFRQGLLVREG
jgi:hypothetical protein